MGGKWSDLIFYGASAPLILLAALVGPARTAAVGVLGRMLVRVLFGQNPFKSRAGPTGICKTHGESSSVPTVEAQEPELEDEDYVSI